MKQEQLALWVSRLFHPFVLPVPVVILTARLGGQTWREAFFWGGLMVVLVLVPATLFIFWKVKKGDYTDMDVSRREQRPSLYLLGVCLGVVLLTALHVLHAPPIILLPPYAVITANGVAAVLNHYVTKVSIHAIASAGCALILGTVSLPAGVVASAMVLAVGWSRVYLQQHSWQQVLLGWGVGIICTLSVAFVLL